MNPIPRGTVTFLFTDIEGSTRLWATHPQQMKVVQVRHDDLVRRAVEECGGYVFKTVGDQTCAAFADANDGLRAAVDAQRAIQAEQWPAETGPLKVRMGLHTGSVEMRDGDYFGFVLSQIARLHAAAHGGQILISRATSELVQDRIPDGLALRDLGAHRLKDLLRPEQVFQVDVSDLPSVFPPLKTLDSVPNNLPIEPYPLVGRSAEIAEAKRLLQSTRLLTLTGPGGTGKTRLALQIGAESLGSYADGVFFVPLAQVSEPEHVPASIANALSVMERPHEDISSTLLSHLSDHELLLLLDNMEQVLPAATSVSRLLERAPKLKVIVTSREPLHVQGEQEFVVPPLLMPETGCDEPLEVISQYEAVELFIQRGRAVNPAFQVTNANAPAVAELCVRLDGLPLAIELAASRMKIFTPNQLLDRLGRHLSVLSGNRRDSPERHQTLRNTIEWSYNLLTEPERLLFERLAVFAGGFTVEAAEEVCGSATARTAPIEVVEGIESLIDKSLIQAILDDEETEPRFRMLQTIREYALSRFDADAQAAGVRDAHAAWYANLAEGFREVIWGSASSREEKVAWMRRISIEYDNIHAALEWASTSGQPVNAFRIVGALLQYYVDQFKLREALDWSKRLLAKPACVERKLLGPVYRVAATAAHFLGDEKGYREFAALTEELAAETGSDLELGMALMLSTFGMIGNAAYQEEVERRILRAIELFERSNSPLLLSRAHNNVGEIYRSQGRYQEALAHYEAALSAGDRAIPYPFVPTNIALAQNRLGDRTGAHETCCRVLREQRQGTSSPAVVAAALLVIAATVDHPEKGVRLISASSVLNETTGYVLEQQDQVEFDAILAELKAKVPSARFKRYWQQGAAMNIDSAIAYALGEAEMFGDEPADSEQGA